jgi:hypothetical protein
MGGQGYFFPTKLLKEYCNTKIHSTISGEDIHLGYVCWLNNIPTYVLDKDKKDIDTWQDITLGKRGHDDKAQWRYPTHKPIRNKLMNIYTTMGWKFKNKDKLI